ncbi:replication initiator protein A [Pectinatus frisingensis]|uniref:replication initiator protein A n=1 Tax=Pectinatus frisingensis TaxID=865 RepID=UPI0018C634CE|nr:replication initiator protein A [Pectinatus frisingensis]
MERFKLGDIDNERYYQIPKSLFKNVRYAAMSLNAKVIYAFLKDRFTLSRKNRWIDDNGDIFLLFSHKAIAELMGVSEATVKRAMNELKEFDLIFVIRQGLQKPNKIYINKIPPAEQQKDASKEQSADRSRSCKNDQSGSIKNDQSRSCTDDPLMNLTLNDPDFNEPENKVLPPIVPKGTDRSENHLPKNQQERFIEFWQAYPKKIGKGAAEKAYLCIRPDPQLHDCMMKAVYDAKRSRQWQTDNGRYIPNPSTWLNQRRWEDELDNNVVPFSSPQADMAKRAIEVIMNGG